MELILILIVGAFVFGGGGYVFNGGQYRTGGISLGGLLLIVALYLLVTHSGV
jgi:hypothetical protein